MRGLKPYVEFRTKRFGNCTKNLESLSPAMISKHRKEIEALLRAETKRLQATYEKMAEEFEIYGNQWRLMANDYFLKGEIGLIRDYCETDALNTYLIYLRFQQTRGILDETGLTRELDRVRHYLEESPAAHLRAFLDRWNTRAG